MKVVFHRVEIVLKIVLSSTKVDLQMLESKFCSFSVISLLFHVGVDKCRIRLTQPTCTGAGPELGNNYAGKLSHPKSNLQPNFDHPQNLEF
jgi:hypothetical protein